MTFFFRKSYRLWENMEEYSTVREAMSMSIACWTTKAAHTPSESLILIVFLRQQWLRECASELRFNYILWLLEVLKRLRADARSFSCLSSLHASPNNFSVMKSKQTRRAGHLAGLGEMRNSYTFLVVKCGGKIALETMFMWASNIKIWKHRHSPT